MTPHHPFIFNISITIQGDWHFKLFLIFKHKIYKLVKSQKFEKKSIFFCKSHYFYGLPKIIFVWEAVSCVTKMYYLSLIFWPLRGISVIHEYSFFWILIIFSLCCYYALLNTIINEVHEQLHLGGVLFIIDLKKALIFYKFRYILLY